MAIDREKVTQAAQGFVSRKRYDRAIAEYQKLLTLDANDARTLLKIGDLQSKLDHHDEAVATYERVAGHYAKQGFALKAVAVYKQIREIIQKHLPERVEEFSRIPPVLAQLYTELGLVSDAIAVYDEIAIRLIQTGRERDAIGIYRKVVDLDPTNPLTHLRLAEAHSRAKEVDSAVQRFQTAAGILVTLNRKDDALKVLERLLHHKPEPKSARLAAEMYLERSQPNDGMLALSKLQVCFQADPRNLETLELLARAFVAIGQIGKSVEVRKEMARLAREQGNQAVYRDIVNALVRLAPNDPVVQQLASAAFGTSDRPRTATSAAHDHEEQHDEAARAVALSHGAHAQEHEAVPEYAPPPTPVPAVPPPPPPAIEVGEIEEVDADAYLVASDSTAPVASSRVERPEDIEHVAQVVQHAESFCKVRLYSQAIRTLRAGLERVPRSVALREKLAHLLVETGDVPGAVDEYLRLAMQAVDTLDGEMAISYLLAVTTQVPDEPRALEMLSELGYDPSALPPGIEAMPEEDPSALDSLPATDLESIAPDAEPASPGHEPAAAPLPAVEAVERGVPALDDLDDEVTERRAIGLDEPAVESDVVADVREIDEEVLDADELDAEVESVDLADEVEDVEDVEAVAEPAPSDEHEAAAAPSPAGDAVEEALEEVEFFVTRQLFEDAHAILQELLERFPAHPVLLDRLREIDAAIAAKSAQRAVANAKFTVEPRRLADVLAADHDDAFDLSASLEALDAQLDEPSAQFAGSDSQVDVEEVFAKFKAGVKAQISETDSQTHYDLGLAYQEMGLAGDAIEEFEIAARDPKRAVVCWSMSSALRRSVGQLDAALEAMLRAHAVETKSRDQELSILYELGDLSEARGSTGDALAWFQELAGLAPAHDDPRGSVEARIRALTRPGSGEHPAAVGAPAHDEVDDLFDRILS